MFKSMSLAGRLSLGFVSILMLLLAVAATSGYAVRLLGDKVQQIVQVNNLKSELANDLMANINNIGIHTRSVALFTDMDRKSLEIEVKSAKEAQKFFAKVEGELTALLAGGGGTEQERQLMSDISLLAKKAIPEFNSALSQAVDADAVAAVLTLSNRVRPLETDLRAKINDLVALQRKQNDVATKEAATLQRNAHFLELVLVGVALIAGGLIAWRITTSVTIPIARAVKVAERIALGDLTSMITANTTDETGRLLQAISAMQDRLKMVVGGIRSAADTIKAASGDVAAANMDLSNRTEKTAFDLQETSHSMSLLTGTVAHSAESAGQANQLASSAAQVAERGGVAVAEAISTMEEINTSSNKIADIISVIDGIAFQTNILALNAAVEAARAGEQGRGFAVVASEVRNLAGRSAQAAKEIKVLINANVDRVARGSKMVVDAGQTMSEIVTSVQRVLDTIGEITLASSGQTDGINRINEAIASLDNMTQQNAALVEQGAAAAASLNDQAIELAQTVSTFKLER